MPTFSVARHQERAEGDLDPLHPDEGDLGANSPIVRSFSQGGRFGILEGEGFLDPSPSGDLLCLHNHEPTLFAPCTGDERCFPILGIGIGAAQMPPPPRPWAPHPLRGGGHGGAGDV